MDEEDGPMSRLGTREYWEEYYQRDLKNLLDHGDAGDIWFGPAVQNSIVERSCHWHSSLNGHRTAQGCKCTVLEIGAGNGQLLYSLYKKHPFAHFTGIEYVQEALEIAVKSSPINEKSIFTWKLLDFLTLYERKDIFDDPFSLIFDKGTFDAITLGASSSNSKDLDIIVEKYKKSLSCVSKSQHTLFTIVSCNWTLDELNAWFLPDWSLLENIPTGSKLVYGGAEGQTTTAAIYKFN